MESEFRRSPDINRQQESLREFHEQVEAYILEELRRSPQMRAELEDFYKYIRLIGRIEQAELVHQAIDALAMPTLPIKPLPSDNRIFVGDHMVVTSGYTARACWPDRKESSLELSDGNMVTPKQVLGKIDIVRNLPHLSDHDGVVIKFARHLIKSSTDSLIELAQLSQADNPRLHSVEVYGGVSHLARIAGKLHFTVFPISDARDRREATAISKGVASHVVGTVSAWKELEKYYKPAEVAFISRESLVKHFGSTAISRGFIPPSR